MIRTDFFYIFGVKIADLTFVASFIKLWIFKSGKLISTFLQIILHQHKVIELHDMK